MQDKRISYTHLIKETENCTTREGAFYLTKRRHDMGNLLGDETSCKSSTPLTYSTLNVLPPNGQ